MGVVFRRRDSYVSDDRRGPESSGFENSELRWVRQAWTSLPLRATVERTTGRVHVMQQPPQSTSCPDCHALTDDLDAHERWHSRLVHDIAVAVDKENKRRDAAAHAD